MAVNPAVDQATPEWHQAEAERQKFTSFFRRLEEVRARTRADALLAHPSLRLMRTPACCEPPQGHTQGTFRIFEHKVCALSLSQVSPLPSLLRCCAAFTRQSSSGAYYAAFGEDAMNIARWYFSTTGVIKHVKSSNPLPYVTCDQLPPHS
jgi:hypothetical protein